MSGFLLWFLCFRSMSMKTTAVYFQPFNFKAVHLFCPPACPHPCWFSLLSICLLDGPLCHSATNGHCWASHFLNDTLLRSIQLPCSYAFTPLSPLFLFLLLPPSHLHHFLSCTTRWPPFFRAEEKSSVLSISSQYFPLDTPLDERTSSCPTHARFHTSRIAGWMTDWQRTTGASSPRCSPTQWFVHSSFTLLRLLSLSTVFYLFLPPQTVSLSLLLIIFILYVCVCARYQQRSA